MGTRADFYIGRGETAKWVGSIAWDGMDVPEVMGCTTEEQFLGAVDKLRTRDDFTDPERDGWPWPWPDSRTTDYAYAFDEGETWVSCFGSEWWKATAPWPEDETLDNKVAVFPLRGGQRQGDIFGPRSGVIVFTS